MKPITFYLLSIIMIFPLSAINQDFSNKDFNEKAYNIDKNIEFYWDEILEPDSTYIKESEFVNIPFNWSVKNEYSRWGEGTFHTHIKLPKDSPELGLKIPYSIDDYTLYLNGELIIKKDEHNRVGSTLRKIEKGESLDIILNVYSYNDSHGGLLEPLKIGDYYYLLENKNRAIIFDAFLFGVLLITGFLYCSFYLSKKDDKSSLVFGCFALVLSLRTIIYGEHLMLYIFRNFPLKIESVLGHMTFYIGVPLFLKFISITFPFKRSKIFLRIIYIISFIYVLLAIVTPIRVLVLLLIFYQIVSVLCGIFIFILLLKRSLYGDRSALVTFGGFVVLLVTAISDMLIAQDLIYLINLTPIGMLFFIFTQGILLCSKIAQSISKSENLTIELTKTNISLKRFVPQEILNFLGRKKLSDVKLGDHVQLNMTVMFCDIRDFTTLSENMSPRENFLFLNSFLERIGPVVRKHGGFIDKYMGDGIMSLFPEGANSAVEAAMNIFTTLDLYNKHRANSGYEPISLGIGINTGSLMLGTIGENKRMDGTVISDAVNICSRIESITKEFGINIAISENTYRSLFMKNNYNIRNIGRIFLKGKKNPVSVFELFNLDSELDIKKKNDFKDQFEEAINIYEKGYYIEAKSILKTILKEFPSDSVVKYYLKKLDKYEGKNTPYIKVL